MTETNTQSNPFISGFAPQEAFAQMQQFGAQWAESVREQLDQWVGAAEQLDGWQREGLQRAGEAAEEMAKLVKSGLEYGGTVAEQWRVTSVEAVRRTIDLVAPKA